MKILLVHNFYREPGGEDAVFAQEQRLLERKGHRVITYTRSNEEAVKSLSLLKTIVSAQDSRNAIEQLLGMREAGCRSYSQHVYDDIPQHL